jgi:glycosyltransferase involved in cell wall biosynthesis
VSSNRSPGETRLVVVGPTTPPFHGGAVMTERLLSALRAHGLLAAHLDTRDPRPLVSIGRLEPRNVLLGIEHSWRFARLLVRNPGAGVYVPISQGRWGFLRDAVLLLIARLAGRRRIVHLHGGYFQTFYRESGPGMRALIRLVLAGVEQAWVLTEGLRAMFEDLVPPERVKVVANAVEDPSPRSRVIDGDGGEGSGPFRVLYLSNFAPGKGWDDLITAAERLSERDSSLPLHLRLVGEFPAAMRPDLLRRAERLARSGIRVDLLGTRTGEAKKAEYRWADLFAYPSTYLYDGQPLVLLEAMAAGLPIVTSAMGGIGDTVSDGETAVVIAPGDVDGLVRSIEGIARDEALRRRLGAAARRRYLAHYTPECFAQTVGALIGDHDGDGARATSPPPGPLARPRRPTRRRRRFLRT